MAPVKPPHSTGALSEAQHAAQNARYREQRGYDYVFIGTGNAALSCAALLARAGHRVCMLEAHDVPGGYAQTFRYGGYAFCAQVHYVWGCGPGGSIHQLLDKLDLASEVTYEPYAADGYDHMATPDGKITKIPYGLANAADSVAKSYPHDRKALNDFFAIVGKLYDQMALLPPSFRWHDFVTAPFKLGALIKYRNKTLQQLFDECGLSRESRAVLCANAGDFMLPPERLSVLMYAALMGGYGTGAYYPTRHYEHHIMSLARCVTDAPGCDIYYENRVVDFVVEGGALREVVTADGKVFRADRAFVCNVDPQAAAQRIGMQHFPTSYREQLSYEYSDSALMVYLGVSGVDLAAHGFGRHNTWRVTQWDMNQTWREQNADNHAHPWLFISTPTMFTDDGTHAPPGAHIMELGTLVPYRVMRELKQRDPAAYKKRKRAIAEQLIDLVEEHHLPDLRKHIDLRLIGTPTTNEDFVSAPAGNAYGSSLTPENVNKRLGYETPIGKLFWCNATAGYPSFCGTAATGMELYMQLTGDRFVSQGSASLARERREELAWERWTAGSRVA